MKSKNMTIKGGEEKAEQIVKLTLPVDNIRDHIQGPPTAPVTLLEYGDYQCPYCGQAYQIIKQVQKHLGNKLRFVFRNFPITQFIPMHNMQLKQLNLRQLRISFGRCMITYTNINKHLMIIT